MKILSKEQLVKLTTKRLLAIRKKLTPLLARYRHYVLTDDIWRAMASDDLNALESYDANLKDLTRARRKEKIE